MVNRISQKHSKNLYEERREVDAEVLIASQMPRRAVMAGLVTLLAGNALWLALSLITGKVYPWFSVLQGIAIGLFTRRWGQGSDRISFSTQSAPRLAMSPRTNNLAS